MLPSLVLAAAFALPSPAPLKFDRFGDPLPPGALARFGSVRFTADAPTLPVAVSPDGKRVAFRGFDQKRVFLFDPATGRELADARWTFDVKAYAFLSDTTLAVSDDLNAYLWEDGKEPARIDLGVRQIRAIARSPDGTRWAVGAADEVHVFGLPGHQPLCVSKGDENPRRIVFSADGKWLLGRVGDGGVRLWDAATGKRVRTWLPPSTLPDEIVDPAFTADGKGFFAVGYRCVQKYRLDDDAPDPAFEVMHAAADEVVQVRPSADGKRVRMLRGYKLTRAIDLDPDTGKVLATHEPPMAEGGPFTRLLPDDTTAVGDRGGKAWRWDVTTGDGPPVTGHGDLTRSTFAADGVTVRSVSSSHTLFVWDAATGRPTAEPKDVPDVSSWNRSLTAVVVPTEKAAAVREVDTGRELARVRLAEPGKEGVAFHPDADDLIVVSRGGTTTFYDTARRRTLFELPFGTARPVYLSASRRTALCLTTNASEAEVWETASGRRRSRGETDIGGATAADPDGRHVWAVARGPDAGLVKIDLTTGQTVKAFRTDEWAGRLAVSPDGRRLVGFDPASATVTVFDTATGRVTHEFPSARHWATHAVFNAEGTRLVTSGAEGVAYVWDLSRPVPLVETPKPAAAFRDATAAVHALRNDDAAVAHLGMTWLHAHPADGLTALAVAFPPAVAVAAARLEQLLADRDAADFKTRLKADKELAKLGPLAEQALKAEAEKPRSEEVRAAVEVLLAKLNAEVPSGERLAELRAVEVVERVGTPEAVKVLTAWAAGAATATLTTEAKAGLARRAK